MNTSIDPDLADADNAFKEKRVIMAKDVDIQRWLQAMCMEENKNEGLEAREVIRAITLNNIQMARVIENMITTITKLNQDNGRVSDRVKTLTWFCAILGGLQVIVAFAALCHAW